MSLVVHTERKQWLVGESNFFLSAGIDSVRSVLLGDMVNFVRNISSVLTVHISVPKVTSEIYYVS